MTLAQLDEALRARIDESAELEARFYLLAHAVRPPDPEFERIDELLATGARLKWDVTANIARVRLTTPVRARMVEQLAVILSDDGSPAALATLKRDWS